MKKKPKINYTGADASAQVDLLLARALLEDIGDGDITACAIIPDNHNSRAVLKAEETFILAGLPFVEKIFRLSVPGCRFRTGRKDGDRLKKNDIIAGISGNTRGLLAAERTSLNLLQRLSGIATLTRRFVDEVRGLPIKIMDTRKTTPGLRLLEKYAVKTGGGHNHRFGLYDGILIKDNHINAAGGIKRAVMLAKKNIKHSARVEVEVKNISEVKSALSSGAEIIMLDNMTLREIRKSVKILRSGNPGLIIEASGRMRIDNVKQVAETGVDWISVGALTHSAAAVDISMDIIPVRRGR